MSDEIEIDGDTTTQHWQQVKTAAREVAMERLTVLTTSIQTGVRNFQRDAAELVREAIQAPPPKPVSGLEAFAEGLADVAITLIPEAKEAKAALETAKAIYDAVKSTADAVQASHEEIVAKSVDDAREKMTKLADDFDSKAPAALQLALERLDASFDAWLKENPQPLADTHEFYAHVCDGIGLHDHDADDVRMQVWNSLFKPYKVKVLQVEATLHFLKELDSDLDRLKMLMDAADQGTDPAELVVYIGGDPVFWAPYLEAFKTDGREAAIAKLQVHEMFGA
jgi:hypothetical protein